METEKAKHLLLQKIAESHLPHEVTAASPEFQKWKRDTEIAIERIFGPSTRHPEDFKSISFSPGAYWSGMPDDADQERCQHGLELARVTLESMIDEIREYGLEGSEPANQDAFTVIAELCARFPLVVRQLQNRHANRPPFVVKDEYDVQDLMHALLHLNFDDIRPEEWTPSYAGASSRMDFLLKQEQIVIEVKMTRSGLGRKEVGDQLLIDMQRYQNAHKDCKALICFVYDPEHRISNPRGLENDLSGQKSGIKVQVIIAPKGT